MSIELGKGKFIMTPEEQKQHKEVLRRQRIFQEQGLEGEKARKQLEDASKKLTPEELERGWQEIEKRK